MGITLCYIYPQMADFEMTLANHLLRAEGKIEIKTFYYEKIPVVASSGLTYLPDLTLSEVKNLEVDHLILPGGRNLDHRPELLQFIRTLNEKNTWLSAICAAPAILANAGILEGRSFTTSLTKDVISEFGLSEDPFSWEACLDRNVVRDRNIVTARGNAFVEFAVELLDCRGLLMDEKEKEEYIQWYKGTKLSNF